MSHPKVFISYSEEDAEWVRKFAEALREQSIDVWLDAWQLQAGDSLRDALEAGLRSSDAIVAVVSTSHAQRPWLLFELGAALGMGKRLIPIVPLDVDQSIVPSLLGKLQRLVKGPPAEVAREVAEALQDKAA